MKDDYDDMYNIYIYTDEKPSSIANEIRSLGRTNVKKSKPEPEFDEPIIISDAIKKSAKSNETKKKKKKKKTILTEAFGEIEDDDDKVDDSDNLMNQEADEDTLLDIEKIMSERDEDSDKSIIKEQKKGYKKLKKDENPYKKEFAEEITLLYGLLDEMSKFGKALEKDLNFAKGSKARGVSKYTNDLAEVVLSTKDKRASIIKEIAMIKKNIADLKLKSEVKEKSKETGPNSPEYIASAYFKNVMNHGRNNFVSGFGVNNNQQDNYDYDDVVNRIESANQGRAFVNTDDEDYMRVMMDRLNDPSAQYRSSEGSKYIEYENRGVQIYVKKCVETGEWDFIALDKNGQEIYDYPLPTKRDAGRMKFSDDGRYATDSKGRIYNLIEYLLGDEYEDDDEEDEN